MGAGHGQLLGLRLEAGKTTLVQLGQVTRAMAQRRAGIGGGRQNDLGIAQVEQAFLARAFEHVLGQRQVAPPSRDCRLQLAALQPTQVAHGNLRQLGQLLDHLRMRGNAATKTRPRLGIGLGVDNLPTALAEGLNTIKHHACATTLRTCGSCQKASRTAGSEKRWCRRCSMCSAHTSRCCSSSVAICFRP
ncbi:hypothetical protein D3C81_1372620 [compost metagenome]